MRIGILTGGGDAPGLNAVIRAAVLKGEKDADTEFVGFIDGWEGVFNENFTPLFRNDVRGIGRLGGTILGTSRTNPIKDFGGPDRIATVFERNRIDAIMVIGGEGTLAGGHELAKLGFPVIGVPKTIDNDISGTDYTFGFDTAVQIATDAMDRLRTTGESHRRCMVAEVMGRHAGWIALHSGIAAGAHAILIPERKTSIEQIGEWVLSATNRGRSALVVVSEGFGLDTMNDPFSIKGLDSVGRPRLGGIGEMLAPLIEAHTGIETRGTTLGHIQRGGTPTANDRVLATRYGMAALDLAKQGKWDHMVALRGTEMCVVPLEEAVGQLKSVPDHRYDEAAVLFG
ncbi:6-phosphofructokinase [Ruicaihuangia caeni]|uniref:ATP-dependent 6-phosphofructokinase n=1 Tax=Ruicaihuangia caeni TaxID=3042517 RepID=A0AAW6T584_9MICO|nr:ATP-dependent 6-phosphofructokinase [Klugiella sp. YN-L-19]MDI2098990.1 ATP-dependent 6-phosphofructokinase [Klugiella sp. YN-L-19]